DLGGQGLLVTAGATDRGVQAGRRGQRVALCVVHDLGGDLTQRTSDDQPGPVGGAADVLADPEVSPRPPDGPLRGHAAAALEQSRAHFFPAFPALRRMTSPWYLMPLPL